MPIDRVPDWEKRIERQDAFWQCEIIDRPVVTFAIPREKREYEPPAPRQWASHKDRWTDAEYIANCTRAHAINTEFWGDALPCLNPNLGPEVFSAFFGQEMEFGANTTWSIPILEDWNDVDSLQFSTDNAYWRKLEEMTDVFLEVGRNTFYTGITDLHPGGDAIAAFRDPMALNIDMIECPDNVKTLLRRMTDIYFRVYDYYFDKLRAAGQATTCWAGIVSSKKWYVPSNDFSCMISKEMFDDVFLPGIAEECRHMDATIYHLDGPTALHHLDSLLEIPELNAIQWVYGAGNGRASDWLHVYRKCQAAGKAIQIYCGTDELPTLTKALRPQGVWLGVGGVRTRDQAEHVMGLIRAWR